MSKSENKLSHRRTARRSVELLEAGVVKAEQVAEIDQVSEVFSLAVTDALSRLSKYRNALPLSLEISAELVQKVG